MTVVDLSHPIFPGMPVYPGSEPPHFATTATIAGEGYLERRISLQSHAGTHVDAPAHLLPGGATLDRLGLAAMVGRGVLVDLPGSRRGEVAREELEPHGERLGRADFALFRSGWSLKWGTPAYDSGYPVLSTPAAAWLAGFPLKGVGFDAPSADAPGSCDLPVHRLLLGRGMVIVENLANLEALPDGAFTFLCLPLPLADAEGAPARAAAFIDRPGALTPPEPRA